MGEHLIAILIFLAFSFYSWRVHKISQKLENEKEYSRKLFYELYDLKEKIKSKGIKI